MKLDETVKKTGRFANNIEALSREIFKSKWKKKYGHESIIFEVLYAPSMKRNMISFDQLLYEVGEQGD